jgi:hypothetical protein
VVLPQRPSQTPRGPQPQPQRESECRQCTLRGAVAQGAELRAALLCRSRTELSDPCTPHPVWLMHTRFPGVDGTVACLLNDSKGTLNLLYRNLIQQLRDISQSQNQGKTCSIHDLLFCLLIIIVTHCRRYSVVLLQFLISHCFCRASPGEPVRGVPMRCHVGIDFSCRRHCEYNTVPSTLLRVLLRCH